MRPPLVLLLVVMVYAVLGLLVLLLAGVVGAGLITWDVKGFLLTGWRLALFSTALGVVALIALAAVFGLWQGRDGARMLALSFWLAGGVLALVTDRSVSGPGEALSTYLVGMILLPGGITAAILFGVPSIRRYFTEGRGVAISRG